MVRPTLEYASTVWDPSTQRNNKKVKAVQRRAAHFAFSDYRHTSSPSQMIEDTGWQSLQNRRSNAKMVMVYKITYDLVDILAASFFHPTSLNTQGHSLRYLVPNCRTDTQSNSAPVAEWVRSLYFSALNHSIITAVSGVGSSPALATCETSQVLLAGVSSGFPGVLPIRPTYRLARLYE